MTGIFILGTAAIAKARDRISHRLLAQELFPRQLMRPRAMVVLEWLVNPRAGWQELDEVIRVEHGHAFFPDHGGFDFGEMWVAGGQFLFDWVQRIA